MENFVIHVKIEVENERMAKAIQTTLKEGLQELCKKTNQLEFEEKNGPTPKGEYLTINELCKLLKVCRMTIWRHSKEGILHPRRIGNRVLFARADIDDYLMKGGNHGEC